MTHLHVPDGVLPVWLWVAAWALALAAVGAASVVAGRDERARALPVLGVVSALVLVAMSLEIVPLGYHVNLTIVAGALLGPGLAVISAFVVSTLLALLGHGGLTVVGVNTLVLGAEMLLGGLLFRGVVRLAGTRRAFWAGAAATVVTLAATSALLVGIVALAGASGIPGEGLSPGRFAAVVFVLGPVGWAIEALVTGSALGFLARARPELLFDGAGARPAARFGGDEQGGR